MKWLRWGAYALLALVVVGTAAYWWVFVETHRDRSGSYVVDIAEVRRLADSLAGDKPRLIRVETVANFSAPKTIVVAGDGWQHIDLPMSSYELVYPDHSAIIDAARRHQNPFASSPVFTNESIASAS